MPHLRPQLVAAAGAVLLLGLSIGAAPGQGSFTRLNTELRPFGHTVALEVNLERRRHGEVGLRVSRALTAAARQHSMEMAANGYFAHTSGDGQSFSGRLKRFYPVAGHRYWAVGETLVWSARALTPAAAVELWRRSAEHWAILIGTRWREFGVSAVRAVSAPGAYGDQDVIIVTADFGVRR